MVTVKKEVDSSQLEVIRKIILTKLNSIKKKGFEDKSIDEFSLAFRVFILRYLQLDYEFTEEELSIELDKRKVNPKLKERILRIANLLTAIKYENKKITKEEFKYILDESIRMIEVATHAKEKVPDEKIATEKAPPILKLLIKKIFSKKDAVAGEKAKAKKKEELRKQKEKLIEKKRREEKLKQERELKKKSTFDEFLALLNDAKKLFESNKIPRARAVYMKAREVYISLSIDEKKKVYSQLMEVYKRLEKG